MIKSISIAALAALSLSFAAHADADEDELVRLPGQGEVRDQALRERTKADRLKPGAGLFLTFDADSNGRISASEIDLGIPAAFENADANQDGYLTALEQRDWAAGLPTRDDSLANPFRFDPNLDRRVDLDEFTTVIINLGQDYANEESGDIIVAELKAPKPRARDDRDDAEDGARPPRGERPGDRRNQTLRIW
ncbi:MAG: EF-hand domain-containing protein [Pseudomonadota bacterium]